ncbi:DEKNAAC100783 [Brettanomyces naardenensis]|uniref:Large ribosomal subunit protein mL44 n=1 Tax=Brettanomyces naardenensis TaxID=13370 RepID=A0A448YEQ6_BRENA|nr:DEKNAAC100783 [Brettanomyces naardenensis]
MLKSSRRVIYSLRLSPIRRALSTSPVKPSPLTVTPAKKRSFKFSYERSNNAIVEEPELKVPENKLDFGKYERSSYKLKIGEEDAKRIPSIVALHSRLGLSPSYQHSTLARALTCKMKDSEYADNKQMALFGANLLSFYVTEHLITEYPRLPISILKNATDAYIGDFSLCDVAKNSWGIEEDETSNLEKYLSREPKLFKFGRLRYDKNTTQVEKGITKFDDTTATSLSKATAFADSVRAIIAGVYAHDGESKTKKFIDDHILSRKVDISSMFEFREPGKLLARLLKVKQMEAPTVRLISETGRLSNSPMFVVGCFSGDSMLAGGEGSSLKEARIRSFVNSLKAFYLYRPLDTKVPSDDNFKPLFVDEGEPFY